METLTGRRLNQDLINFKPKCHHLVLTNNKFHIDSNDWGTWRRIVLVHLRIEFVDLNNKEYNPANPYQRPANPEVSDKWVNDDDVRSKYLSYMVWVHYWLYRKYRGKVKAVPHPHIQVETEKYRREQNAVDLFISQRMVSLVNKTEQMDLMEEVEKYVTWYNKMYNKAISTKTACDSFLASDIANFIKNTKRGIMLEGYRFLDFGEEKADGEMYYKDIADIQLDSSKSGVVKETPEEFYARICREYDEHKHIFDTEASFNVDTSALNIKEERLPIAQPVPPRTIIDGVILPGGIITRTLEDPVMAKERDDNLAVHENLIPKSEESDEEYKEVRPQKDAVDKGVHPDNDDEEAIPDDGDNGDGDNGDGDNGDGDNDDDNEEKDHNDGDNDNDNDLVVVPDE
jgi:hypothetical protein